MTGDDRRTACYAGCGVWGPGGFEAHAVTRPCDRCAAEGSLGAVHARFCIASEGAFCAGIAGLLYGSTARTRARRWRLPARLFGCLYRRGSFGKRDFVTTFSLQRQTALHCLLLGYGTRLRDWVALLATDVIAQVCYGHCST